MRKILVFLARSLAVVLAVLFVLVTPLVLLLFNAEETLFNSNAYKRALVEVNFYEQLPSLAGKLLAGSATFNPCAEDPQRPECLAEGEADDPQEGGPPAYLRNLTQADWEIILSFLLPPDWLQAQTESVLDQFFANLDTNGPPQPISLSLKALKERIDSEAGLQTLMHIVRSLPPCDDEQLAALRAGGEGEDGADTLLSCRPPDEALDEVTPLYEARLAEAAAGIPDEATWNPSQPSSEEVSDARPAQEPPFGGDPRQALRVLRLGIRLSLILPVVLALLVAAFAVRSRAGLLRWWGIPFMIVGLIGIAVAVIALPLFNWAVAAYASPRMEAFLPDAALAQMGWDVLRAVARTIARWFGGETGLVGLIGLAMLVVPRFIKPKLPAAPEPGE